MSVCRTEPIASHISDFFFIKTHTFAKAYSNYVEFKRIYSLLATPHVVEIILGCSFFSSYSYVKGGAKTEQAKINMLPTMEAELGPWTSQRTNSASIRSALKQARLQGGCSFPQMWQHSLQRNTEGRWKWEEKDCYCLPKKIQLVHFPYPLESSKAHLVLCKDKAASSIC